MKQKIDIRIDRGPVTVKMEPWEIDLDPDEFVDGPVEAMAEVVKESIRNQPGDKWDKTGTLLNGVRAEGSNVVGPPGRLGRDETSELFDREVLPPSVLDQERVKRAIQQALDEALGIKK